MISSSNSDIMGFQMVTFFKKFTLSGDVCSIEFSFPINKQAAPGTEFIFEYCMPTDKTYDMAVVLGDVNCF